MLFKKYFLSKNVIKDVLFVCKNIYFNAYTLFHVPGKCFHNVV